MRKWLRILTGHSHASNSPFCLPKSAPRSPATVHGFRGEQGKTIFSGPGVCEKSAGGASSAATAQTANTSRKAIRLGASFTPPQCIAHLGGREQADEDVGRGSGDPPH